MKKILLFGISLILSSCTFTHPVKGEVENKEHERFLGTATASLFEENASLDITTDSGTHCSGTYPRPAPTSGGVSASGTFQCSDGRIGHFTFGGTAHSGVGFGKFNNGQKFKFVYGDSSSPEDNAAAAAALQSFQQNIQPTAVYQPPSCPACQQMERQGQDYAHQQELEQQQERQQQQTEQIQQQMQQQQQQINNERNDPFGGINGRWH